MAEGTPGLSPPQAVTTSPLPPTALHPRRALSLTPAPCGPHPSAPALGEEEEARERKRKHIMEQGTLVQSWSLGVHRRNCSCSEAGKPIGGDTGEMSPHIRLGPSPPGLGTLRARPSAQPSTTARAVGTRTCCTSDQKVQNEKYNGKSKNSVWVQPLTPWETQFLPGSPLLPVFGARM